MPNPMNLTGHWTGSYSQNAAAHPIEATITQTGDQISGTMRDVQPDRELTVFDAAAECGLPPGADEQIEAKLREMFPDAASCPIRYITHLPPDSSLNGHIKDSLLYFLKSYIGEHYGGYKVGERFIGETTEGHSVHYEGKISSDAQTIEGTWWINPPAKSRERRVDGSFTLRRDSHDQA